MIRVKIEYASHRDRIHIRHGDYADNDARLHGMADYLVRAGHAVRIPDAPQTSVDVAAQIYDSTPDVNTDFAPDADYIEDVSIDADEPLGQTIPLAMLTRAELYQTALDLGCDVKARTPKAELIKAIEDAQS